MIITLVLFVVNKTNVLLYFHMNEDIYFTINVSVLEVLPECHVSEAINK